MNKIFFVDFDRTLFNTHEFFQDFSTVLASEFQVDGKRLHDMAHRHNVVRSKATGIFSAFDMMREEYPNIDVEAVKAKAQDLMAERTYTFVDVKELINRLSSEGYKMKIITVGTEEYQTFKHSLAPELSIFDFIVTQETKGACLKKMEDSFAKYQEVTLIDDRADTFDEDFKQLNIRGIRLNRVDSQYGQTPTPHGVEEVTSLFEVEI